MHSRARRCILAVFAHPDDETSSCGGTFTKYAREGVEVHVVTATRGELGELGTGGQVIERQDLPAVREAELRAVMALYGAHPPTILDYRDQELATADFETLVQDVLRAMNTTVPDVVLTFGPTGISDHEDHKAIHRATLEAFQRYQQITSHQPRLFFVAIPEFVAQQFEFSLHPSEMQPHVQIDITGAKATKLQGLRTYRSQADAQELATLFEGDEYSQEWFHQAHPPASPGDVPASGFWPE